MTVVKLPFKHNKEVVVIWLSDLKTMVLEFDEEVSEFSILALHNCQYYPDLEKQNVGRFRTLTEVNETGKKWPFVGKLRSISSYFITGFGYIVDDWKFLWVELR